LRNSVILFPLAALALLVAACSPAAEDIVRYPADGLSFAVTNDGWKLAVYHLPAAGEARHADPVIMCHGFTSTSVTFDQGDGRGLGPYLAKLGYDVWMVNLRGRPPGSYPGDGSTKSYGWTVDDYIRRDVPAILKLVCDKTGARRVTWIGHSMGGMVMYAHLGQTADERVARFIAVSSPLWFTDLSDRLVNLARRARRWVEPDDGLRLGFITRVATPLHMTSLVGSYLDLVVNRANVTEDQWRRYLVNGVVNVSGAEALQIADWSLRDVMISQDGRTDYRAAMRNIRTPLLAITGKVDFLAPPSSVLPIGEWVASADKTVRVFSVANGNRADYGHLDILIGRPVTEEVFPFLTAWLKERE